MSHNAKQNIQTATNILVLIGLVAGGVFYFSEIRTTLATQDVAITNIKENVNDVVARADKQSDRIEQQGKDIAAIKYYFDNGVLRRLQLEELKQAAASQSITKSI